VEKKPVLTPLKEKKKPDTSLEVDKQTAPSPDETVDAGTPPKESDKIIPGQVESDVRTPTLKETDGSANTKLE